MRQDADVLVLGELADKESLELAIEAAGAGKLVFVVFSSAGAIQALEKLINIFPEEKHAYIRRLLASCLRGVVFQKLVPAAKKQASLRPAVEVLLNSPDVSRALRDGKLDKVTLVVQDESADSVNI